MKRKLINISLLIFTLISMIISGGNVLAQQMLLQVLGGGYRFDGPNQITFTPVQTSSTTVTPSTVSIRDVTTGGYINPPGVEEDGFISVEDQNGGTPFEIHINATGALTHDTYPAIYQIPLTSFKVINSTGAPTIETLLGLSSGLSLHSETNDYIDLSIDRTLVNGTGQQPGKWKFFPGFKIEIPPSTPVGTYSTTITFTII